MVTVNEKHNEANNRKRDRIHQQGVPIFSKTHISIGFNCIGCRKHFPKGERWMVTYHYIKSDAHPWMYERNLGKVCSEICYSMAVMRFS